MQPHRQHKPKLILLNLSSLNLSGQKLSSLKLIGMTALLLALFLLPSLARATEIFKLKQHIEVSGDVVTLGDLFERLTKYRNEPVFRSPELGREGTVSLNRIIDVADRYDLIFDLPINLTEITITRPSRTIKTGDIEDLLKSNIVAVNKAYSKGLISIEFDSPVNDYSIPLKYSGKLKLSAFDYDKRRNRVTGTLTPIEARATDYSRPFSASVSQSFLRPVLTRAIERDQIIQKSDIAMKPFSKRRIPSDALVNLNDIVGMAAKQTLRVSSFMRLQDLIAPKLVKKNQLVTLLFQTTSMTIKTQAKAMEDGSVNDTIQLMNMHSKRIIHGTITAAGMVVIQTPDQHLSYQATAHLTN